MPSAEIIAIGTELLLGEIQDTNSRFLARTLREINVDLFRTTTIGDNVARISALMLEAISRSDIVICTGGLGPTVDDPTREAAAKAFDAPLEYHPELWEQIQTRFSFRGVTPSENNKRQAYIPASAIPIENPVGTAPSFILRRGSKSLVCLPGVPHEMEALMQTFVIPYLVQAYNLRGLIKVKVLHTAGVPESRVDQLVADFETWQNPTLGLLAHPGSVDIRITAKAESDAEADALIAAMEKPVRERFGNDIFGENEATLIETVKSLMARSMCKMTFIEAGPVQLLGDSLHSAPNMLHVEYLDEIPSIDEIKHKWMAQFSAADEMLFYSLHWPSDGGFTCISGIIASTLEEQLERIYKGPEGNRNIWAANTSLDFMRRKLIQLTQGKED